MATIAIIGLIAITIFAGLTHDDKEASEYGNTADNVFVKCLAFFIL